MIFNRYIWPIDGTLSDSTSAVYIGPKTNASEIVLLIPTST